jgi:predicted nucleotide-binding protein (sugar kinase/HSP70/actin superfamily)
VTVRIGVPRGLSFFRYHPAWEAFFRLLGAEIVVSSPSTRATLEAGRSCTVSENCLPIKLFFGHVCELTDRVDVLLVPSIHRFSSQSTNCAKLIGLPDLLRATIPHLPPLIAPDIDLSEGIRALWTLVVETGTSLTFNPLALREAALSAWAAHLKARAAMLEGTLTPAGFDRPGLGAPPLDGTTVAVIGHPYNLYDPFVNHNLLARLAGLGVGVLTPERLGPWPDADYWTFEYELVGAARLALESNVAGLVAVVAFGCGPDAVMLEELQGLVGRAGVPLMTLTLDEHSGEAGLVTRIEAFVDMLKWRRERRGSDLPGH